MADTTDTLRAVDLPRIVRRGWRGFVCECGRSWKTPTRDHKSPSVDTCPACYADTPPCEGWPDETLMADTMGNLLTAEHAYDWTPNAAGEATASKKGTNT